MVPSKTGEACAYGETRLFWGRQELIKDRSLEGVSVLHPPKLWRKDLHIGVPARVIKGPKP